RQPEASCATGLCKKRWSQRIEPPANTLATLLKAKALYTRNCRVDSITRGPRSCTAPGRAGTTNTRRRAHYGSWEDCGLDCGIGCRVRRRDVYCERSEVRSGYDTDECCAQDGAAVLERPHAWL